MTVCFYTNKLIENASAYIKDEVNDIYLANEIYFKYMLPYAIAGIVLKCLSEEIGRDQVALLPLAASVIIKYAAYSTVPLITIKTVNKLESQKNCNNIFKAKEIKIPVQDLQDMMKHLEFLKK